MTAGQSAFEVPGGRAPTDELHSILAEQICGCRKLRQDALVSEHVSQAFLHSRTVVRQPPKSVAVAASPEAKLRAMYSFLATNVYFESPAHGLFVPGASASCNPGLLPPCREVQRPASSTPHAFLELPEAWSEATGSSRQSDWC